jgi:hypothetical protein
MAFRAWNRGLAATTVDGATGSNAYGVWLYNGTTWFPDPTFPGSSVCPGDTVLWAGKLDYWLIGSAGQASTTLCHFDGTQLDWDPLTLPTATLDQLPLTPQGTRLGGITSGTCLAYDNCWFLGTDGIKVHWDGEELADESNGLGGELWLDGNFTSVASTTTASGASIAVAVNSGEYTTETAAGDSPSYPLPADPFGAAAPQLFGLTGGSWSPLATPAALPGSDLVATGMDGSGDTWVAAEPSLASIASGPAPLTRINPDGSQPACPGYGPDGYGTGVFSYGEGAGSGYLWASLGVAPDVSVFAGGSYSIPSPTFEPYISTPIPQPVIAHVACGASPTVTQWEFLRPDPLSADQGTAPLVPADSGGSITAVSASATNDAWAATSTGVWAYAKSGGVLISGPMAPHFYQFTDGQTPDAPAGNDDEARPSLFTLSPPVYEVTSPIVVSPTVTKTVKKKRPPKRVTLAPAVYALRTTLGHTAGGTYSLHLLFKVRRPVTLGLAVLHGKRVVARTPLERFRRGTGELSIPISRDAWPTGLKLLSPPASKTTSH